MYKDLLFGQDARTKIKEGVNILADAVSSTLGPRGQNVIFEDGSFPTITKDGVTVAQQVFLEDKFQNMGNMTAREAAENTNREAGDGTTTTIVLLRELFNRGHLAVTAGMNPILIKRGMDDALQQVLSQLASKEITTDEQKEQIAVISANNDSRTGKLIADIIKTVGVDGVITVTPSNSLETTVDYVKGTKISSGYENHLFINDAKNLSANMVNPEIIITTDRITMESQINGLIQDAIVAGKRNFVLFADVIEGQALAWLVQNYLQGKFTCVPVKIPSFGGWQKDMIYDLATLVGATVLGEDGSKLISAATITDLGNAETVIVDRNQTIVSNADGDVTERLESAKALLEEEKDTYNRAQLKNRIGRLSGSIANIKVGGASEAEQTEIRYRMEDAINATKSAIEEGIVEGGGCALLRCSNLIIDPKKGEEYNTGIRIVKEALEAPLKKIVDNSGISGEAVVAKVKESAVGYNALTDTFEDLFKAGIIDPKKVVRNEITNAVATAGILLTSNTAIAIKPEHKK